MTSVPLYELPIELLEAFLSELAYPDLSNARNVSHAWRTLCNSTAISNERKKLLELRYVARSDQTTALIRTKIDPFIIADFDREQYLAQIGADVSEEFAKWVLETPVEDIIGWHWPGLRGEHARERFDELGLDYISNMMFSRHLKPGYTLLPSAKVMEVDDPDYSEFNDTDLHFYPGSFLTRQRPARDTKVRALQIWADLSNSSPKITGNEIAIPTFSGNHQSRYSTELAEAIGFVDRLLEV